MSVDTNRKPKTSDSELHALKRATAETFTDDLCKWLALVHGKDSQLAFAALAQYLGYILAGAALELGIHKTPALADNAANYIAEVMDEQMQRGPLQ